VTDSPLFSIVIPTYNRLEFLRQALSSVWSQTFTDYEVIVVDDGSTDGTTTWLQTQVERVRVVAQSNRGPGAARNTGAQNAHGAYVAFLDSDDWWFPWTLATFARAIQDYGNPQILGGRLIEFENMRELTDVVETSYEADQFGDFIASSHQPLSVGSGTCVVDRNAMLATQFIEDRLNSEDHDLILRLGTLPGFIQIRSPITVAWRRHLTTETHNINNGALGALRLSLCEKSGAYPGGEKRARERRRIVARHLRPASLTCLQEGEIGHALELYRATFVWNLELGHWKYLAGLPILMLAAALIRRRSRRADPVACQAPGPR